jgi:hypothetical protein
MFNVEQVVQHCHKFMTINQVVHRIFPFPIFCREYQFCFCENISPFLCICFPFHYLHCIIFSNTRFLLIRGAWLQGCLKLYFTQRTSYEVNRNYTAKHNNYKFGTWSAISIIRTRSYYVARKCFKSLEFIIPRFGIDLFIISKNKLYVWIYFDSKMLNIQHNYYKCKSIYCSQPDAWGFHFRFGGYTVCTYVHGYMFKNKYKKTYQFSTLSSPENRLQRISSSSSSW